MAREKQPESKLAARFQDCDPFGHLNNAKYLEYFINAREDHLVQAYGFDLNAHARESGCAWVIARHQIAYLAPVGIGEEVLIRTSLRRYTDQSASMEGLMYDAAGTRLKSLLWTEFAYVRLSTGKPTQHGAAVSEFLAGILLSEEAFPADFAARERALAFRPARP